MRVIIFGGPRDGEDIPVPDGATTHRFPKMMAVPGFQQPNGLPPNSPFGPFVVYESWNIKVKMNYWSHEDYLTVLEPRFEKWLIKSFASKDEVTDEDVE